MQNSHELYLALQRQNLNVTARDPWWWPDSGRFAVVVGALLTQQSRWPKVEESLDLLREANLLDPGSLAFAERDRLIALIRPSGCFNSKADRLKSLSKHMLEDFGSFEAFQFQVNRPWLLAQPGIGEETADAILCYACYREAMVVDAYTLRLLLALGMSHRYGSAQQWLVSGIETYRRSLSMASGRDDLALVYAHYHGMIVEYAKQHSRGKVISADALLK